jgi:broad specificity phosphatase PhoE
MVSAFPNHAGLSRALFVLAFWAAFPSLSTAADTVFFVVRHAERAPGGGDVPLSADGQKRAEQLMQTLEHLGVSGIYHTSTIRTTETAKPLATKLKVTPVVYADPSQQWIDNLVSTSQGKRTLIVGHGNAVHQVVGRLIGREVPPVGDRFDALFIVVISENEKSMVRLSYGKSEPSN